MVALIHGCCYKRRMTRLLDLPVPPGVSAVIVQQGKVLDFIDGQTQRDETPEEYVRQEIAKSLVREYGYPKSDILVEFTLRVGSRKPRADLVIFASGSALTEESRVGFPF